MVSDNGPQFASTEFASFVKKWNFEHVTSSPHYAQSNGKAENAVKTVKQLFNKCKEDETSEFLVLLDWRNTPSKGMGTSPAQGLMDCQCIQWHMIDRQLWFLRPSRVGTTISIHTH